MASEREIAFARYWEGKERRPITVETVRNAYLAGWSDKPEFNQPKPRAKPACVECGVEYPSWIDEICDKCSKCHAHCGCTSMDCDCGSCIRRYELWREDQGMGEDPTAYPDWRADSTN